MDLYHTGAIAKIPAHVSFSLAEGGGEVRLVNDLDRLNFRELPAQTLLGWVRPGSHARLEAWDEHGREVGERFPHMHNGEIGMRAPVMSAMFTVNAHANGQACLGYLMENFQASGHEAW